jgi:hypothetical protein
MEGTTTTTSDGEPGEEWGADAPTVQQPQIVTGAAVGDTCANCGNRLAADQRYCVECGERRGKARYSLSGTTTSLSVSPATSTAAVATGAGAHRRSGLSWSSGTVSLIAGVATLLLAMGVGVLIGRSTNPAPKASGGVQVVTVAGSGGAAAAAAPAAAGAAGAAKSKASAPTVAHQGPAATTKKALTSKAVKAKLKVIPKQLKTAVVKTGSKCTAGEKGCSGGKFTGNFFGGG